MSLGTDELCMFFLRFDIAVCEGVDGSVSWPWKRHAFTACNHLHVVGRGTRAILIGLECKWDQRATIHDFYIEYV